MRAEMGAVAIAVQDTDPEEELTVFTDSLALLWILVRWMLVDFVMYMDTKQHADILTDLLEAIRERARPPLWCGSKDTQETVGTKWLTSVQRRAATSLRQRPYGRGKTQHSKSGGP